MCSRVLSGSTSHPPPCPMPALCSFLDTTYNPLLAYVSIVLPGVPNNPYHIFVHYHSMRVSAYKYLSITAAAPIPPSLICQVLAQVIIPPQLHKQLTGSRTKSGRGRPQTPDAHARRYEQHSALHPPSTGYPGSPPRTSSAPGCFYSDW